MAFRRLSKSVLPLTRPVFSRKFVKIGRVFKHWPEIIGPEFENHALPLKLRTRKNTSRDGGPEMISTLTILTTPAMSTRLAYQTEMMLGRIEHLFGERIIQEIKFIQNDNALSSKKTLKKKSTLKPVPAEICGAIDEIGDEDLRKRLEDFTTGLYQSEASN